jgi:hypothetical protein
MIISIFHLLENGLCLVLFGDCLLLCGHSYFYYRFHLLQNILEVYRHLKPTQAVFIRLVIRLSRLKVTSNHNIINDELSVKSHQLSLTSYKS